MHVTSLRRLFVKTTSLMKKGLRLTSLRRLSSALRQNDFPDEEGIKTWGSAVVPRT